MKIALIGSGITGLTIAHFLEQEGIDFDLFDSGVNVSSVVAAGSINPLVFRRMTLSWRVEEALPFAKEFYKNLENRFNSAFYHEITIRRLFASEQEANYWKKKQDLPVFSEYMNKISDEDVNYSSAKNSFGTARLKQSASVDAKIFIAENLNYFNEKNKIRKEKFDYSYLNTKESIYQSEFYDYFVFCEGKDNLYNPWFSYVPITQTKGELLRVKIQDLPMNESLNRKCFVFPLENQEFKIGSTYNWDVDNTDFTEEAKQTILDNLKSITDSDAEVVSREAGVRPTVEDRRPVFGPHPDHSNLMIANGLGSKGYLLAPILMKEFVDYLLNGKELNAEVKVERFNNLHSKQS